MTYSAAAKVRCVLTIYEKDAKEDRNKSILDIK